MQANAPRPDGRATRWAGQHARRRAEFVEAALNAVTEHGPDASTELIAQQAGVARTRLYKHFDDAGDLQRAVARRIGELIVEELEPVWNPQGTPNQMITLAVDTHLRWLTEHGNLYRYLLRQPPGDGTDGPGGIRNTLGEHLGTLFGAYLRAFGIDAGPADTTAFGLVGYVDSATHRWLDRPGAVGRPELVRQLSGTVWVVLDGILREGGVELDPDAALPLPHELPAPG
ncbi:TetR family transcriptional regulator [Amycolatopsis antarctica]|uniref:TetR family transcriptional regulator n=1 Tax=Amycolatopsis antarctica TaxID=1854586 RepID=A0A263D5A1_9PSEU|nr:TetR/AcrR family transcriptional regulator [Amycolatopsis antarctica]OZM72646.1 TetR family transcriptional regulator [Amycolatopsis antarctica]